MVLDHQAGVPCRHGSQVVNFEQDIALERLAEAKGIKLTKTGKVLTARCPFQQHDDLTAFIIDPKANRWRCRSGCGEGGVVDFVARTEGISGKHAVELLKADFMPEPSNSAPVKQSTVTRLSTLIEPDEPDDVVFQQVLDFYAETLKSSPKALSYLHGRGLRDPDLLTHFKVGFCDRTLGYRIPARNRQAGAVVRGQLQRIGILRSSGHETFRGSVVVPITDLTGKVVQVYGRKITARLRKGTEYHVTLNDEGNGVFNISGFVEGQKVILTYGIMDALTWWSSGFRNVTSTMGHTALPKDVKALLVIKKIRSVWLAFPRDKDTADLQAELLDIGVEVNEVVFPSGSDANDIARNADEAKDALQAFLRASNWLSPPARPPRSETPSAAHAEPEKDTMNGDDEDHQVVIEFGDRRWRIRGLENNTSHNTMRVNVLVSKGDAAAFHVDVIELYSARQRRAFLKAASEDLNVEERILKADMGKVLLKLEDVQDERIRRALEPEQKVMEIDEADRQVALKFLRQPDLLDRILADFEILGVVGEQTNKLVGYLAATSRKLNNPLAVVIQSSSAAGKSSLMEAVLRLFPDEEQMAFSAMTGRSLYYLGENSLAHKVLSIAEEEGASQAAYALKILQSEGKLTIASTGKESKSGRLTTQTYEVSGPVALLMTTTALDVDPELMNRCIVLTVDEGREQTKAIHVIQRHRKTLEGLVQRTKVEQVTRLHHNAQRLLRPLHVVIPQAGELRFADHALRARRDHQKFLGLIQSVVLLRQYQKDIKETDHDGIRVKYIEADATDIESATRLAHDVLGRTLDELPPGTRKLLGDVHGFVKAESERQGVEQCDVRFTRRELREKLSAGNTQLKVHLRRLVDFEFVIVHRGGEGRRVAYELVYNGEGEDGEPFLPGLESDGTTSIGRGEKGHRPGVGRGVVGPRSGGGRGAENGSKSNPSKDIPAFDPETTPKRSIGASEKRRKGRRTRRSPNAETR